MSFQHALILGMVPSIFMLTSTYIGLGRDVPDDISGAMQHFAAGVLLCTVGTELLPQIVNAQGWAENSAAFVGFFLGVAVLILLSLFDFEDDDDDEEEEEVLVEEEENNGASGDDDENGSNQNDALRIVGGKSPTPQQRQQIREMKFVIAGRKFRQRQTIRSNTGRLRVKRSMSLSSLPMVSEDQALISHSRTNSSPKRSSYIGDNNTDASGNSRDRTVIASNNEKVKQFPLAFVLAVAIDSSLDGLLIGISSVAGPSAGPMMSASLSVEMGFLGLTLATTLYGQPLCKSSVAALVGPLCRK